MSYWTKCLNCGKQLILDGEGPEEKCYFCGQPARRKISDDDCGLHAGGHRWEKKEYCRGIERGECDCGAVRFFAKVNDYIIIKRAEEYNGKYGKRGGFYLGTAPSKVEGPPRQPKNISASFTPNKIEGLNINTSTKLDIKEEKMVQNNETTKTITSDELKNPPPELPPVPPRPDVSGMSPRRAGMALHDYYEANAAAILQCKQEKGDAAARKLWGFSSNGWANFLKRHDIKERLNAPGAPAPAASAAGVEKPKKPLSPAKIEQIKKMRAARGNKCRTCEHGYDAADGGRVCSLAKCPYFVPKNLRVPYRPLEEKTKVHSSKPRSTKVDGSVTKSTAVNESNLPLKFPAWNEGWSDAVKAVWLKSYVELYRIEWAREPRRKENRLLKILCWWRR